jgi:hypothetical protein
MIFYWDWNQESDLPCSCPRGVFVEPPDQLPMPATASNRKVLEEYIKDHFRAGAFNTCKRQHWPITTGPPMKIHTPPESYSRTSQQDLYVFRGHQTGLPYTPRSPWRT